ncbi:MAG TPA: alpha/beta family hydrolase [Acidothermaceae bacterium]|jgi:predicted alpha/beta-hydrolase family hydrolase|nr:alpha/beta family hydrolase [Acidothermaceae bacterium]
MRQEYVDTPVGPAAIAWYEAATPARAIVALGHGSATGVDAPDLQAIAAALPQRGITVALITQPYRLARSSGHPIAHASDEPALDTAWRAVWPHLTATGTPMIAGGRSAGSQVACRTAKTLGARGVIALSYPLLGPGSPRELLATGLPTLVVQGGSDPYGTPEQFPPLPPTITLVDVPFANHTFNVPAHTGTTTDAIGTVAAAVTSWLDGLLSPHSR